MKEKFATEERVVKNMVPVITRPASAAVPNDWAAKNHKTDQGSGIKLKS